MVTIFIVCWLPLNLLHMAQEYSSAVMKWHYFLLTFLVTHVIAMSSTIYNPFLYAWMNDNFKKEFQQVTLFLKTTPYCHFFRILSSVLSAPLKGYLLSSLLVAHFNQHFLHEVETPPPGHIILTQCMRPPPYFCVNCVLFLPKTLWSIIPQRENYVEGQKISHDTFPRLGSGSKQKSKETHVKRKRHKGNDKCSRSLNCVQAPIRNPGYAAVYLRIIR